MRRVLVPMMVAVGFVGMTAGPALALAPTPGAGTAAAVPGKKVCTIDDDRMVELSGLVATASGYVTVNDSSDLDSRRRVFLLDKKCGVKKSVEFASLARDPEDLAITSDRKTIWIGDTGDGNAERDTVALWKMPVDGSERPSIYRLTYPDGAKDAEALLIGADGVPIIITKGVKTFVYKPTAALKKGASTPMKKVGEVVLPKTSTGNPLGLAGRVTVTGAAASPDGARVVLRTYADAFEFDVANGDMAAALVSGKPRITPLPDEPWGEAITYSTDGASFLTVSETVQSEGAKPVILRYTPVAAAPKVASAATGGTKEDTRSFFDKLDLDDITMLIGVVGVIGVLMVGAGVAGIVLARRKAAAEPPADDEPVRAAAKVATAEPPVGVGAATPVGVAATASVGAASVGAVGVRPDGPAGAGPFASDRADSGAVYGAARVGPGGAARGGSYASDRVDSGAVYGGREKPGPVYGSDRVDSGAVYGGREKPGPVYGSDRADSGAVYGGGREKPGPVYGSDRADSGAVYGGGREKPGPVYGSDQVDSGAVYGAPADYRREADQYSQQREQGGQYRPAGEYGGGAPVDRGYRAGGHPDERHGGNAYQDGGYPPDGYTEQPVAGRRPDDAPGRPPQTPGRRPPQPPIRPDERRGTPPPVDEQGYGDGGYDYGDRGGQRRR